MSEQGKLIVAAVILGVCMDSAATGKIQKTLRNKFSTYTVKVEK